MKSEAFDGCWYCGDTKPEVESRGSGRYARIVLDHVRPIAKGGGNDQRNLVPACWGCNGVKSSKSLEDFREFVEWRAWSKLNGMAERFTPRQLAFLRDRFRLNREAIGVAPVVFFFESGERCEALAEQSRAYGMVSA